MDMFRNKCPKCKSVNIAESELYTFSPSACLECDYKFSFSLWARFSPITVVFFPFVTFYLSPLFFTKEDGVLVLALLAAALVAAILFSFWAFYFKRTIAYEEQHAKKQKVRLWFGLSAVVSICYLIYLSFET